MQERGLVWEERRDPRPSFDLLVEPFKAVGRTKPPPEGLILWDQSQGTGARHPSAHFNAGRPKLARCFFRATQATGDFLNSPTSCVPEMPSL